MEYPACPQVFHPNLWNLANEFSRMRTDPYKLAQFYFNKSAKPTKDIPEYAVVCDNGTVIGCPTTYRAVSILAQRLNMNSSASFIVVDINDTFSIDGFACDGVDDVWGCDSSRLQF
jgi:hypothetical protein